MKSIFQKFFKGIMYFLTLPALLVVLALVSVVGVFYFLALGIKAIILFFRGMSLFNDLPEDIEVRKVKQANAINVPEAKNEEKPLENNMVFTANPFFNFGSPVKEEKVEESPKVEEKSINNPNNIDVEDLSPVPMEDDDISSPISLSRVDDIDEEDNR